MFHCPRSIFPTNVNQKIADNLSNKVDELCYNMANSFLRYDSINKTIIDSLNKDHEESNNYKWEIKNAIIMICELLDTEFCISDEDPPIPSPFTVEDIKKIIRDHLKKIKSTKYLENINCVKDFLLYHCNLLKNNKYSFQNSTEIFTMNKISTDNAIKSIICMLFARDNLNIDSIIILRNHVINSPLANIYVFLKDLNTNPSTDLGDIFLSDYIIINDIVKFYYDLDLDTDKSMAYLEYNLEIDGKFNTYLFDFYCMIIYFRYIISIYLMLVELEHIENKNEEIIEHTLIRIYRDFSLITYNYVYTKLSIIESIHFLTLEIINDVSLYSHIIFTQDEIRNIISLASSVNGAYGYKDHTKIIVDIVDRALSMLKGGSEFDHIDFLEYFENSKKYGKYFSERGFKRNLSKAIKKMMDDNGINRIRGKGFTRRGYKRPRKKKKLQTNDILSQWLLLK